MATLQKSFRLHLPNAKLVIDKFHVVRMASEALDTERKALQNSLDRDARLNMKNIYGGYCLDDQIH